MDDDERALADYNEAIRIDPKVALAHYNRSFLWAKKGDLAQAARDLWQELKIRPDDGDTKSELEKLIRDADKAVASNASNAASYAVRGLAYQALGQSERALHDYDAAIKADPKYASAYRYRAEFYLLQRLTDRAVADYSAAIDLDPKDADAFTGRGGIHLNANRIDPAIADLARALSLDPQQAQARSEMTRALQFLDLNIKMRPREISFYLWRASAHAALGDLDRALADASKVIGIDPQNASAYEARARLRLQKNDRIGALGDGDQAIRLKPSATAHRTRGGGSKALDRREDAIADYRQALGMNPDKETAAALESALKDLGAAR